MLYSMKNVVKLIACGAMLTTPASAMPTPSVQSSVPGAAHAGEKADLRTGVEYAWPALKSSVPGAAQAGEKADLQPITVKLPDDFETYAQSPQDYYRDVKAGKYPAVHAVDEYCADEELQRATPHWTCSNLKEELNGVKQVKVVVPQISLATARQLAGKEVTVQHMTTVAQIPQARVCHAMSGTLAECHNPSGGVKVHAVTLAWCPDCVGKSPNGRGMELTETTNKQGTDTTGNGLQGTATTGNGLQGTATTGNGLQGDATTGNGLTIDLLFIEHNDGMMQGMSHPLHTGDIIMSLQ